MMKDKIEEILEREITGVYEKEACLFGNAVKELSTLIQEERNEAIEDVVNALHGFRANVVISTVNGNPLKKSADLMDYFDEYFAEYLKESEGK